MTDQPIIQFNPKLPRLASSERTVLKLLVEAAKLIVPIYNLQENKKFPGANLYPHDATKKEIEEAAKRNPDILSAYTVVERMDGKLVVTPYHIKYARLLKPVADKLNEAASMSENKEFSKALKVQAKALVDGSYAEATIAWLKIKLYILDISIGPIDHFDDQLFFAKASYQAWVGVLDIEGTERLNNYKSIVLTASRKELVGKMNNHDMVKVKVDDVVVISGLIARTKFVGISLPIDLNIVEKYGSEVTLFNQLNDLRIKEQILPTFNKIFSKAFRQGFNLEDLRRGYLRAVALHELAHSYLHYRNAARNLQDLFPCLDELAATILGLRMAGSLLLKDRITNKQLESMIVAFLCRSFYHMKQSNSHKPMFNYALGGTIFINFLLKNGALKHSKRMMVPNFMKIFVSLHELLDTLEHLLSSGTHQEAGSFIKKYSSQTNFQL